MKQMFYTQDQKIPMINILDWDKYCLHCHKQLNFFANEFSYIMFRFPFSFLQLLTISYIWGYVMYESHNERCLCINHNLKKSMALVEWWPSCSRR
jgi:hypothetical protein